MSLFEVRKGHSTAYFFDNFRMIFISKHFKDLSKIRGTIEQKIIHKV